MHYRKRQHMTTQRNKIDTRNVTKGVKSLRMYTLWLSNLCSASYVAINTTLLAFAADRRAAVDMDRNAAAPAADAPCSNRANIACSRDPQQQTHRTLLQRANGTDRLTDRRTPDSGIDPASHTMRAASINIFTRKAFYYQSELSMGPSSVTRSNPTHQLTDPTRPNPV